MTGWTVPRCPSWCTGKHEAILTRSDDPTELDATASLITHACTLTDTADGLAVELIAYEPHPDEGPAPTPGAVVFLPDAHGLELVTATTLRGWARALADAADLAEQLTNGEPTP